MKNESTTVNHGVINYKVYGKANEEAVKHNNPTLKLAHKYFNEYKNRSTYIVAMKYHTAKIAHSLGWTLVEIAELINVKNHATVHHLLKGYVPLKEHDQFIKEHYMNYMQGMLYPLGVRTNSEKKYNLVHISKLEKNEERQQAQKQKPVPKEWPKF